MLATGEAQIFSSEKEQLIVKENQAGKHLSSVFNKPDFFFFSPRNSQCLSVVAKKVKAAFKKILRLF